MDERLPETRGGFYLVCVNNPVLNVVMEAEWRASGSFHRITGDMGSISNVTHWRPLPTPPSREGEKQMRTCRHKTKNGCKACGCCFACCVCLKVGKAFLKWAEGVRRRNQWNIGGFLEELSWKWEEKFGYVKNPK